MSAAVPAAVLNLAHPEVPTADILANSLCFQAANESVEVSRRYALLDLTRHAMLQRWVSDCHSGTRAPARQKGKTDDMISNALRQAG